MAQEFKSYSLLNIKPTLALPRNTKHIAIDGQVYFHRQLIADPVKPQRGTIGSVKTVNGINKDVSGARLLPTIITIYPAE